MDARTDPILIAECKRYKQRNLIHSHVYRRGVSLFGDNDRHCRHRMVNGEPQRQEPSKSCGESMPVGGQFPGKNTDSSLFGKLYLAVE
jgi:hypothetical protein